MTSAVLLGTAYRTAIESAQASYSYYVLTAACLAARLRRASSSASRSRAGCPPTPC